ncbi:MAG: hypothetical protein P1R58_05010 [bacterium]|nr:hypothetical protein [bacterium]
MKKTYLLILSLLLVFTVVGCEEDDNLVLIDPPPAAPQGVYSITGDGSVTIAWNGPYEADLDHYVVLRSLDPIDNYTEIGTVEALDNPNLDLIFYTFVDENAVNGVTYFYAVLSVDMGGKESDLSAEPVYDTPRPEGIVSLANSDILPDRAGFIFALGSIVDTSVADISVMTLFGVPHLHVRGNGMTWIQDMGSTVDFFDVTVAPAGGWSSFDEVELIEGHTYAIFIEKAIDTGNYAKVRAVSVTATSAKLEWGYQPVTDNPELKVIVPGI